MLRDASPQPELPAIGIDIVRVSRIAGVLQRHPTRFETRVLTDAERAYVRARPETMSGRWAAKEAVSKVLGLGVTDPLTGMVSDWAGTIVTAYVGGRTVEKVAKIFMRDQTRKLDASSSY